MNHTTKLSSNNQIKLNNININILQTVQLSNPPHHNIITITFINPKIQLPQKLKINIKAPIIKKNPTLTFNINHLTEPQIQQNLPNNKQKTIQKKIPSLTTKFTKKLKTALNKPLKQFKQLNHQ